MPPKQAPSRSSTGKPSQNRQPAATQSAAKAAPTDEQIQRRAYEIYVAGGHQEGLSEQHWAQAEAELRRSR